MRIIIETDERQSAAVVKTSAEKTTAEAATAANPPEPPAISAGSAPDDLLQALGENPAEPTHDNLRVAGNPEARGDAMGAGPAPDWLVQAIESAHRHQRNF
jgi:hypothetical protein